METAMNENYVELKSEVNDLLNQLAIKLKNFDYKMPTMEDDDYQTVVDEESEKYDVNAAFLYNVKVDIESLMKRDPVGIFNSDNYYNSNC